MDEMLLALKDIVRWYAQRDPESNNILPINEQFRPEVVRAMMVIARAERNQ